MTTNYERAFAARPEVLAAWSELNGAIKAGMDLRRYELATLAAARRLRSSYCSLAHGTVLLERFGEPVLAIALDRRAAGLDEVDVAVMDLAERVVDDATSIGDDDLQRLRDRWPRVVRAHHAAADEEAQARERGQENQTSHRPVSPQPPPGTRWDSPSDLPGATPLAA